MAMLYVLCLWLKSINACFLGLSSLQPLSRSPIYWPEGPSWCTAKDGSGLQDSDVVWWVFCMLMFALQRLKELEKIQAWPGIGLWPLQWLDATLYPLS